MPTKVRQPYKPVAHPLHTAIMLLLILGGIFFLIIDGESFLLTKTSNPVRLTILYIVWNWALVGYIAFGVRRHGGSLHDVIGERWQNVKRVFRDVGLAFGCWIVMIVMFSGLAQLLCSFPGASEEFLALPQPLKILLWSSLSITAGICEEIIFRGYLQKQFEAWTGSAVLAMALSTAGFLGMHIHFGWKNALLVGLYGILFSILAKISGSLRPGMIAHAWHDLFLRMP